MDISNKIPILVFLVVYTTCVSGVDVPKPDSLVVNIQDGRVIALWDAPVDAPSKFKYNVQMAKYNGADWAMVASCTSITVTYCDLSNLIRDYGAAYKVRVQLAAGEDSSEWRVVRKFLPNKSELQPPSFTLWATSSTLTVKVHRKPILRKLFPFGITYTIYLEERGQEEKNTTAYLKDDIGEDQRTKTFDSLHWGREYCVSVMVEGNGGLSTSAVTHRQCLLLPEQEWFIIAVSSLSMVGVMAAVAVLLTILYIYLRRPEKTPVVLKPPGTHWVPFHVEEGLMEVVTDKAWLLTMSRPEVKNCKQPPAPQAMDAKDSEDESRRTSMDSGLSMESNRGSRPSQRQEDSGCGSMGGSESSTSCNSQTEELPLLDGRTDSLPARTREDSGVRLGCQLDCLVNPDGPESGGVGNYRGQSVSPVQSEERFEPSLTDSPLTDVVTGYRAAHHPCVCAGAGQCTWCRKRDCYGPEEVRQYTAASMESGPVSSKDNFSDSYRGEHRFPVSSRKTHIQVETEWTDDSKSSPQMSFTQLSEDFPLLTALSSLPLMEGGQDFSRDSVSLSLCDVELKND